MSSSRAKTQPISGKPSTSIGSKLKNNPFFANRHQNDGSGLKKSLSVKKALESKLRKPAAIDSRRPPEHKPSSINTVAPPHEELKQIKLPTPLRKTTLPTKLTSKTTIPKKKQGQETSPYEVVRPTPPKETPLKIDLVKSKANPATAEKMDYPRVVQIARKSGTALPKTNRTSVAKTINRDSKPVSKVTSFCGIALPWAEYASQPLPALAEHNTIAYKDMISQLTASHACFSAAQSPGLSIEQIKRSQSLSADKKNTSVDTLRTRIQLEVSTQRAALALLQLEREPVVELRSSTQRIEMLVDELFFRISEASESHWHSLQQVAGTLARGFPHSTQHNNRDSRNLLFIRIETIAAKYAKSHKKSLSSLRTGNVSDDDSSILSTDDSIFSKSVRTSITSVEPDDDYSQSVAVNQALNSIQRQFIDYEQQSVDDQNEICKLREKLTQEQYRCEALESKVVNSSELKDQIARLQLELAEKQEAEAFKTNQSERQQYQQDHTIAQLELQLSLEQSRREELEKHHVNFQEQMAQLQLELTEKQQQQQHSQDQIADLELNIRQENTRKEDQIARCREVLNCSLEEAIETMSMNRQEMERVKQQLIQQEAASSSWQSEAAAKEAEVLSLRNHVLTLQQQNAATERFKVPDMSFEEAQRAYTIRESALMLQTASLEAELGSILKEYERLTRHITDFNLERKKYDQQLSEMMDEIHRLQAALADEKTKRVGDENGTTAALRKEFRNLMAGVKAEQQQTMEHEWNQRQHTENELRALKHDLEMKRWEKIDVGVQTGFVAYPLS